MGKQRILWIDCLKGIGILSVVFVHITGRMALFVYAIPLFFMLSGYLFHKQPIADYAIKTARRMVVPYTVFLLIISSLVYGQEITDMGGGNFERRSCANGRAWDILVSRRVILDADAV